MILRHQFFSYVFLVFLFLFASGPFSDVKAQQNPSSSSSSGAEPSVTPSTSSPAAETENSAIANPDSSESIAPLKEAPGPIEASKVDISDSAEAQDELYSQDKLPFRYLNQYFTYDVKDGVVNLNEKAFTLNNIELSIDDKKIVFSMKDEMLTLFKKGRTTLESESGEELFESRFELKNDKFSVKRLSSASQICFQIKSRYSNLKICRTLSGDTNQSIKIIRANKSNLGDNGQIVVQETGERSEFKVEFNNQDSFYFETGRRKVYPATIQKKKDSEELQVRFVDLDVQTLAWEDKLTIDQRFFEIKLDPLIQLRQDMLFSDPKGLTTQAFSKTLIQKKQILIITKNKLTVSPLIVFSQLVGSNDSISAKLTTKMGSGAHLQFSQNFQPKWDWFLQSHFYSTKIVLDDATKTLIGSSQSLYQASGGTIYHWKKNWDIELGAGVRTDMFLKTIEGIDGAEVFTSMNKYLSAGLQWTFFKNKYVDFYSPLNFRFVLPGNADGATSNLGSRHEVGFYCNGKLSWGKIYGGFSYGIRQQNYGLFNFSENYANSYFGLTYLF